MYRNGGDEIAIVLLVLIVIVVFALLVGICAVVGSMADTRGRSVLGWVLFSLLAAPISIILLLFLRIFCNFNQNNIISHITKPLTPIKGVPVVALFTITGQ